MRRLIGVQQSLKLRLIIQVRRATKSAYFTTPYFTTAFDKICIHTRRDNNIKTGCNSDATGVPTFNRPIYVRPSKAHASKYREEKRFSVSSQIALPLHRGHMNQSSKRKGKQIKKRFNDLTGTSIADVLYSSVNGEDNKPHGIYISNLWHKNQVPLQSVILKHIIYAPSNV
jgi:hypothetical protein